MVAVPLGVCPREMVPHTVCGHETAQFTPAFAPSLLTVAEKGACVPSCNVAEVDERVIVTAGMVIVAGSDLLGSLADAAVRLTVSWIACDAGGVNVVAAPLGVCVGETFPQGGVEHETVQLTPAIAGSFVTVAVNCAVVPTSTVAEVLESDTLIEGGAAVLPQPELKKDKNPATDVVINDMRLIRRIILLLVGFAPDDPPWPYCACPIPLRRNRCFSISRTLSGRTALGLRAPTEAREGDSPFANSS